MRIAVVSDIHANLQAWNAVWLDIRSLGADRVICLGDTIGYGPNPAEVLEALYAAVDFFVLGNHDAALCGKLQSDLFNETAREILAWTAARLAPRARQVLAGWPLTLAGPGFRCAHGEFGQPDYFHYVFEPEDSRPSWQAVPEPLLFIGHTHQPCLGVIGPSGTPHLLEPQDFSLEPGKRYLVNVGSIGCSRDGDPRASYCLFDTAENAVFWRRIPFDLDAFRGAIERAGLPAGAGAWLESDPRKARAPLRERVSFHPPADPAQAVRNAREVQHVELLRRRVRRWQQAAAGALLLLLLAAAAAAVVSWRQAHRRQTRAGAPLPARHARHLAPGDNALVFPAAAVPAGQPVPGWDIHLGDRYHQQAAWGPLPDGRLGWRLASTRPQDLRLVAAPVFAAPAMKFTLRGRLWKSPDFQGSLALAVVLVRQTAAGPEQLEQFVVKEPLRVRNDGWSLVQTTFDLPARADALRVQVRGRFTGSAALCELTLERK